MQQAAGGGGRELRRRALANSWPLPTVARGSQEHHMHHPRTIGRSSLAATGFRCIRHRAVAIGGCCLMREPLQRLYQRSGSAERVNRGCSGFSKAAWAASTTVLAAVLFFVCRCQRWSRDWAQYIEPVEAGPIGKPAAAAAGGDSGDVDMLICGGPCSSFMPDGFHMHRHCNFLCVWCTQFMSWLVSVVVSVGAWPWLTAAAAVRPLPAPSKRRLIVNWARTILAHLDK